MELAHRYAALLTAPEGSLREAPADGFADNRSELELQAHWFAGDFGASFLTATNGERVEVVQFGVWNREAGPDFTDAAVRFPDREGAPVLRGAIELDTSAEDWERHGHGSNSAFDGVILHLYLRQGVRQPFTRTSQHLSRSRRYNSTTGRSSSDRRRCPCRSRMPGPLSRAAPSCSTESPGEDTFVRGCPVQARNQEPPLAASGMRCAGTIRRCSSHWLITLGYKENKLPFALLAQTAHSQGTPRRARMLPRRCSWASGGFLHAPEFGERQGRPKETRAYLRGMLGTLVAAPGRAWTGSSCLPPRGNSPVYAPPIIRSAGLAALAANWPAAGRKFVP